MTIEDAMTTLLAYVSIKNAEDNNTRVNEATAVIQEFLVAQLVRQKKQQESAIKTNSVYSTEKRKKAAKKAWEERKLNTQSNNF